MADNTSTGNSNLDSGLDSLFGNNGQNNQFSMPVANQGQGINLQQLIGGLLQAGGQGMNAASNFVNPQQNQPSPTQQIQQDSAIKSYTKGVQAHADNTPPQILASLIDQWGQQGGGKASGVNQGVTPQAMVPAAQSVATSAQQAQQVQPPSIDDQITQAQEQAKLNVAQRISQMSKSPNFMQRFSQNFTKETGGVTQADQLQNIAAIQKIAGGEPLQTKDVQDLNVGSYKAALDASHNAAAVEQEKLNSLTNLYGKLGENRNFAQKTLGQQTADQSKILDVAKASADNLSTHLSNLRTLITNRPTFSSKGQNPQAQATTDKINQGKVGKYTLVQTK